MSDNPKYCHSCGAELSTGAAFCSRCGSRVVGGAPGTAVAPSGQTRASYREYRHEKNEKQEKHEKGEKGRGGNVVGPVVGGLILVWLGITFYLQQIGTISSNNWWAYFILGIGAIIVLQGFLLYFRSRRPIYGPFIGGAVLVLVGLSFIYNAWENFWPFILVIIGIAILASALARSRTPGPV